MVKIQKGGKLNDKEQVVSHMPLYKLLGFKDHLKCSQYLKNNKYVRR
jgi:hypothetical protein